VQKKCNLHTRITRDMIQTHAHNISYFLVFNGNNDHTNMPQCYHYTFNAWLVKTGMSIKIPYEDYVVYLNINNHVVIVWNGMNIMRHLSHSIADDFLGPWLKTRHHILQLNRYKYRRAQHRCNPTLQFQEVTLLSRHTAAQKIRSYHAIFHVFIVSNVVIRQEPIRFCKLFILLKTKGDVIKYQTIFIVRTVFM